MEGKEAKVREMPLELAMAIYIRFLTKDENTSMLITIVHTYMGAKRSNFL